MDFDRLPNGLLLSVLQRVPFTERVRIACVNRRFKNVSEMAISQTKALSLTAPIFRNANAKSMRKLIQLCAPNLKELICEVPHPTQDQYRSMMNRLQIVMKLPHPRLEVLKIDTECLINVDPFRKLLARLPNLRTMEWTNPQSKKFPNVVCKNLQSATIRIKVRDSFDFVASLAAYCPNVTHLFIDGFPNDQENRLNEAFAKWPALKTLELELSFDPTNLEKIDSLWNLGSLRSLLLGNDCPATDQLLEKISMAFPKLERLKISLGYAATSRGFAVLKNLQHLRQIILTRYSHWGEEIDLFAMETISFDCLETVEINGGYLSAATVATIAHRCPKLRRLKIPYIRFVSSPKKARSFVRSLYGFVQEELLIIIRFGRVAIWDSPQVRSAIAKINKSKNGRRISIRFDDQMKRTKLWPHINEWDTDVECRFAKEPTKGIGRRLIGAIRDLARKMSKMFK